MKRIFLLVCLIFCAFLQAQKNPKAIKVTYQKASNGKLLENQDPVVIYSDENKTIISTEKKLAGKEDFPVEQSYIERKNKNYIQVVQLSSARKIITADSLALGKQTFEISQETKTILGYKCQKAKTIINSNTIELWFTNDLKIKGAPTVLGQDLGLVLEVVRNNNYVISAVKVEKIKAIPSSILFPDLKEKIDLLTYNDLLWKSRFTTITIFKDEVINFSEASKSNDSILRFANGTVILRKIKFPEIKAGSNIFVDLKEQSNGDAYDRTGSVFIIPVKEKLSFFNGLMNGSQTLPIYENGNGKQYQGVIKTENYLPLLELMRFFTPFGIKQYNTIQSKDRTWQESVPYRQDISELRSSLSGQEIYVGTFIGNYDKGGHKINLNITIHDEENQIPKNTFLLPLFNTTNVMEMAKQEYATMFNNDKGIEVSFTLEKDIKKARLRYITTGHGGWENGDEFIPKKNTIFLDEKEAFSFVPWRTDCGSYRLFNPASGNFENGLSSSDYSRSNWCPGTVTNPIFIDLGDLKAGKHTIQVKIPQGENEGGSFSSWNVSGVLIGD